MELGGLVESQIRQAIYALSQFSVEVADEVTAREARVNAMELEIDRDLSSHHRPSPAHCPRSALADCHLQDHRQPGARGR